MLEDIVIASWRVEFIYFEASHGGHHFITFAPNDL
jgi:hypothetical protein